MTTKIKTRAVAHAKRDLAAADRHKPTSARPERKGAKRAATKARRAQAKVEVAPEPSSVATARYSARKARGLTTVKATLERDEVDALDRARARLGLPEFGGSHLRGGRAEAIRRLILADDERNGGPPKKDG
jgi:hypothetical protein